MELRLALKRQAVKKPHIPYNSPFKIAASPNFNGSFEEDFESFKIGVMMHELRKN